MARSFQEIQEAQLKGNVVPSPEFYAAFECYLQQNPLAHADAGPEWPELDNLPHVQIINASKSTE